MKYKGTEKLFRLAYTDLLTEVKNRNAYEEHLSKLRKNPALLSDITVLVADLNNLKEINDNFGHHTGDEALKITARCLNDTIGEKSDIYRVGGDEFVCISHSNIFSRIAEFKDCIGFESKRLPYSFYVSVGYKCYSDKDGSIDELIKECDRRMYVDKKRKKQQ